MLSMSTSALHRIDGRRDAVDARVAAFRRLAGTVGQDAVHDLEPVFFNDLVIVLDTWFPHAGGLDGPARREVRLIAESLGQGDTMVIDRHIRLDPHHSVLGYRTGDEIAVREAGFTALARALFAELESRYL